MTRKSYPSQASNMKTSHTQSLPARIPPGIYRNPAYRSNVNTTRISNYFDLLRNTIYCKEDSPKTHQPNGPCSRTSYPSHQSNQSWGSSGQSHHQHLSSVLSLANFHESGVVLPAQNAQDAIGKTVMSTRSLNLPPLPKWFHTNY
jgi:hypothetical protein